MKITAVELCVSKSHGVENAIFGSDEELVNVNQLRYDFSYKNYKSL